MRYIIITNYKRKLLIVLTILLLWALIIVGTGLALNETVRYTFTVNSQLSFSCPAAFKISNIYSKDNNSAPYIEASNSKYKSFVDFKSAEDGFEFSYPSGYKIEEKNFPGTEILYHVDFQSKQDKSKGGYVQVWNIPYSLEKFLDESKQASMIDFISFSSKNIEVNYLKGYIWEYTFRGASENYKALEIFLSKDSKVYQISYHMPEKSFNNDETKLFWNIVDSLKVN